MRRRRLSEVVLTAPEVVPRAGANEAPHALSRMPWAPAYVRDMLSDLSVA